MKILKSLTAALCAVAVAVTSSLTVFAGSDPKALGYDLVTSAKLSSGKETTVHLPNEGSYAQYNIEVGKKGTLEVELTTRVMDLEITVFDSKNRSLIISDLTNYYGECYTSEAVIESWGGYLPSDYPDNAIMCVGDGIYEGYHGTLSFPVSKGKYTIVLKRYKFSGETNDNVTIRADYPKASASATKFNYLTISLKKGDTLSLGADITGSGSITWKSSKSSVASVSSAGKVTAKSKGSAIITAKVGKTTKKIKIVVS